MDTLFQHTLKEFPTLGAQSKTNQNTLSERNDQARMEMKKLRVDMEGHRQKIVQESPERGGVGFGDQSIASRRRVAEGSSLVSLYELALCSSCRPGFVVLFRNDCLSHTAGGVEVAAGEVGAREEGRVTLGSVVSAQKLSEGPGGEHQCADCLSGCW